MLSPVNRTFFDLKNDICELLSFFEFSSFISQSFRFPINLIFFDPSFFKYLNVSLFWGKHKSNIENNLFENEFIFFQRLYDLFVILALSKIRGNFCFLIFLITFGQISDSINMHALGFQYFKNLFTIKLASIGKNWWIVFLNFKFFKTFAELRVLDVISICAKSFFFSSSLTRGIILKTSPTLDPWNHIKLPFGSFE